MDDEVFYCKGCSFKCQASDCECHCHTEIVQKAYKQARIDEREKIQKEPINIILQNLPIISMIATIATIPSSKRRKNAVVKMIAIEFKKQIEQARAEEREKIIRSNPKRR